MKRLVERCPKTSTSRLLVLSVGLLVAAGCNTQEQMPVSGEVRFDGRPVEIGQIAFYPATRVAAVPIASDIQDGAFELSDPEGLVPGTYQVQITAVRKRESRGQTPSLTAPPAVLAEQYIPEKYNESTILEVEVKPEGGNYFEFDLEAG